MKKSIKNKSHFKYSVNIIILVVIFSLIAGVIVYAEYTKSSRAKRVIAAYSSQGMLFSSNYMTVNGISPNRRIVYASDASSEAETEVTVCNFAQGTPTIQYSDNINYNLIAKLVSVSGNSVNESPSTSNIGELTATISYKGTTVTLSSSQLDNTFDASTLTGGVASTDRILVTLSSGFNSDVYNICLLLKAVPVNEYPGISEINVLLSSSVKSESISNFWTGYFSDPGARNVTGLPGPEELEGFNFTITGSGKDIMKLRWKASAFELNQVFYNRFSSITGTSSSEISETINEVNYYKLGDTQYYLTSPSTTYSNQQLYMIVNESAVEYSPSISEISIEGTTYKELTFALDSNIINRYDLQFYRVEGTTDAFNDWDVVKSYVSLNH